MFWFRARACQLFLKTLAEKYDLLKLSDNTATFTTKGDNITGAVCLYKDGYMHLSALCMHFANFNKAITIRKRKQIKHERNVEEPLGLPEQKDIPTPELSEDECHKESKPDRKESKPDRKESKLEVETKTVPLLKPSYRVVYASKRDGIMVVCLQLFLLLYLVLCSIILLLVIVVILCGLLLVVGFH